jgi:hypothetical protein
MIYIQKQSAGFSLVEVFVAITILLMVIVGPMRMLTTANTSTQFSSEQVIAFFLAQEGLELVQLSRDNLVLGDFKDIIRGENSEPSPWARLVTSNAIGTCGTSSNPNGCGLVPATTSIGYSVRSCASGACRLYLNSVATGRARYTHDSTGNTPTPYTRTIQVAIMPQTSDTKGPQGLVATSTVTWRTGGLLANQKVELVTYLTNVYDTP